MKNIGHMKEGTNKVLINMKQKMKESMKQKRKAKSWNQYKGGSVAKWELFTLGALLIGVIATFASGGIVAVAMNRQEERRQI